MRELRSGITWAGILADKLTDEVWSKCAVYLAAGITDMDSLAGVRKAVENRSAQLWVMHHGNRFIGAIITKITDHDNGRVFTICHLGGTMIRSWMPYFPDLEDYARVNGCKRIVIVGREGFVRLLPGFRKTATVMEKDL